MADKTFECTIITPHGPIYTGRVESASIPAHDGEVGILQHRAPLVCKLGAGQLRFRSEAGLESWFIDGGFAHVRDDRLLVLTQEALRPEQINIADAWARLEHARQMIAVDEVSTRRRTQLETSARARLRVAHSRR